MFKIEIISQETTSTKSISLKDKLNSARDYSIV